MAVACQKIPLTAIRHLKHFFGTPTLVLSAVPVGQKKVAGGDNHRNQIHKTNPRTRGALETLSIRPTSREAKPFYAVIA